MLENYINDKYICVENFTPQYVNASPYPHIVFEDFFKKDILDKVHAEYPDLSTLDDVITYDSQREKKFASNGIHATIFIKVANDNFAFKYKIRSIIKDITPPILLNFIKGKLSR